MIPVKVILNEKHYRFSFKPSDLVCSVNEKVGNLEGVPSIRIKILLNGQVLERSKPLEHIGIAENSTLQAEKLLDEDVDFLTKCKTEEEMCVPVTEIPKPHSLILLNELNVSSKRFLDVLFCLNISERTKCDLDNTKINICQTCDRLLQSSGVRVAVLLYGNTPDGRKNHVLTRTTFTTDRSTVTKFVEEFQDTADSNQTTKHDWVLHETENLNWSENSRKLVLVFGDCEPDTSKNDWCSDLDYMNEMDVRLLCALSDKFPGSVVEDFYPELCKKTQGAIVRQDEINEFLVRLVHKIERERSFHSSKGTLYKSNSHEMKQEYQTGKQETVEIGNNLNSNKHIETGTDLNSALNGDTTSVLDLNNNGLPNFNILVDCSDTESPQYRHHNIDMTECRLDRDKKRLRTDSRPKSNGIKLRRTSIKKMLCFLSTNKEV